MNAMMGLFGALLVIYPTTKSLFHILLSKAMQKLEKRNDIALIIIHSSHGSSRLFDIHHKSRSIRYELKN
jgi:hypothetical protein